MTLAAFGLLALGLPSRGASQPRKDRASEEERIALFSEVVQVAAAGAAHDVSFVTTGFNVIQPNDMVWIVDPLRPGIVAVASRPILDTAKAGETLGTRGALEVRGGLVLEVTSNATLTLRQDGTLLVLRGGWTDSVQVGTRAAGGIDVAAGVSGFAYVLWGDRLAVYPDGASEPLWSVELLPDLLPAVALDVSARGEVFVAGAGDLAVAVYDVDADGRLHPVRTTQRSELDIGPPAGISLNPKMLLPVPGKEGWVENDRFVYLADADGGRIVTLDAATLAPLGRIGVRDEVPLAAPGRLDVSNRGQIAFVDARSGAAWVLPTRTSVALLEGAEFRWRILERKIRVQGAGDPDKKMPPVEPGGGH